MFQSSPGLVTGRYLQYFLTMPDCCAVSILARSGDRALPPNISSQTTGLPVSILARSGDRALRIVPPLQQLITHVSILARSGDRALRS